LHEFVGLFSTNTNPALVFAATKQIPAMNDCWKKARTLVITDGKNNCYHPRVSSHLLMLSSLAGWTPFGYYRPSRETHKV
jgi:hypothetical protein